MNVAGDERGYCPDLARLLGPRAAEVEKGNLIEILDNGK